MLYIYKLGLFIFKTIKDDNSIAEQHGTDVPVVTDTPGVGKVVEDDVLVDLDDPLHVGSVSCADNLAIYRANFAT